MGHQTAKEMDRLAVKSRSRTECGECVKGFPLYLTCDVDVVLDGIMENTCKRCGSHRTKKHTATSSGTPRLWCKDCGRPFTLGDRPRGGSKPKGDRPMTNAERQRRWRERHKPKA